MRPLVTHIMPVWRPREEWLREAVDSVLAQRDRRCELVVVDDGCEQPVVDLLGAVEDARLRVQRVAHGGVYAARNMGLELAQGDWIRYADADDLLAGKHSPVAGPDLRRTERRHLWSHRVLRRGAATRVDDAQSPVACRPHRHRMPAGRFTVRPPAMLFPRALLEATGGWSPAFRVSGDWDFVLRVLERAHVRGETRVALYYRRHSGGVTQTAARASKGLAWSSSAISKGTRRHGVPISRSAPGGCCMRWGLG